ncbi:MAG: ABC transporter permease [Defluviitaleaceae bacterium]|nr:ABC transporter permease [Defluviitaleaceae bacterium]
MWKTIARRFLILIPQLFVLSLIVFIIAQIMPGDALRGRLGPDTTFEQYMALREAAGLNDPWYVQYARWMGDILLRGDFGTSLGISPGRPVTEVIGERMPNTVRLSLMTSLFLYMIAVPLGILAARKKGRILDKTIMVYTFVALSLPSVVFGLFNILNFALNRQWFPSRGSIDVLAFGAGGMVAFMSRIEHLLLPALTGAMLGTVTVIYFLRSEIIDFEASDFVTTAKSKGVPNNKIYTRHILRNALLPIAGHFGIVIAGVFVGSFFIETVFSFSGMGELFITSIMRRDFPVANTLIMFYAIMGVVSVLIADIAITIIDPRIRIK